jgi:hypothetical protein
MNRVYQDFILCMKEAAFRLVAGQNSAPKHPSECYLNPPCGCSNPGKNLQCEDCPYLEACLSQFKTRRVSVSPIKRRISSNTQERLNQKRRQITYKANEFRGKFSN